MILLAFLAISTVNLAYAQETDPPEIMENGEFPLKLDYVEQALAEREQAEIEGGNYSINVTDTWYSTSGTNFVPSSSSITYSYGGSGCVNTGADGNIWRGDINLPHGSKITAMYFNYNNEIEAPADSIIYIYRYMYNGDYQVILTINGTYDGIGNHTHWSSDVDTLYNTVDNFNYAYVLVWWGMTQQNLCGVNLRYTPPPIYLQALPMIKR